MSKKVKRILVVGDLHSGHVTGLTHPDFNPRYKKRDCVQYELTQIRSACWKWFSDWMERLQPIYGLIGNGDLIDGKGPKSGATELITADRYEQAEMAAAALLEARAEHIFLSYGTPYHGGHYEDWEDIVADKVKAVKIGGQDWIGIKPSGVEESYDGLVFDYRHKVGRSRIEHGRFTPLARERLENYLWTEHKEYPKADIIIRSHVHYFRYCGGPGWMACVTPALQGKSKFGSRQAGGTVDFGIVWFDVIDKNNWSWDWALYKPMTAAKEVIWI